MRLGLCHCFAILGLTTILAADGFLYAADPSEGTAELAGEQACVTVVDTSKPVRDVSPLLMGFNIKYFLDTDDRWADGKIARLMVDLKTGVLRFPGGGVTNAYHWRQWPGAPGGKDCWETDPKSKYYLADKSQCNHTEYMDIDEFLHWCTVIGAEPAIGVNYAAGWRYGRLEDSLQEAVACVQHCKDRGYKVKYWFLGNENYGGFISAKDYAGVIRKFSTAMREVDPNLQIMVSVQNKLSRPSAQDWCRTLVTEAGEHWQIADIHLKWARLDSSWEKWLGQNPLLNVRHDYQGATYREEILAWQRMVRELGGDQRFASMEWSVGPPSPEQPTEEALSAFQCALVNSEMFMQYMESGVSMACLYPGSFNTLRIRRGLLDEQTREPLPTYHAFKLLSHALGHQLVAVQSSELRIPAVAVLQRDGKRLWVYLLNKFGDARRIRVAIKGNDVRECRAVSLVGNDRNDDKSELTARDTARGDGGVSLALPGYSLTMVTIGL